MEPTQATAMLTHSAFRLQQPGQWADLGCGSGTFTLALAGLLLPGSLLYAVDIDAAVLRRLPDEYNQVTIQKHLLDFEAQPLPFTQADGILMANSLHYVKDQYTFIQKAAALLQPGGRFLLIEYDTDKANTWVPYPLSFASLVTLFQRAGFAVKKLREMPSAYNTAKLYSAVAERV